jgi:hypothetical protein
VRALAQLKMLTSMSRYQECSPTAGQHIYIDVPLRIESLYTGRGHQTRLSPLQQTRHPTSVTRMHAMCPAKSIFRRSKSSSTDASVVLCPCVYCPNRRVWRLKVHTSDAHQTWSSKVQMLVFHHLTCSS